jgi:enoyl-CoA hydratase
MMNKKETILVEKHSEHSGIYTLTFNRPKALNAMTTQMSLEIIEALHELQKVEDIRVLVITGSGDKGFCVGADLKERNGMTKKQWKEQHDIFEDMAECIRNFDFPVIAAINGFALGGGLEMSLSCDFRVAAEHAKMGLPEARIGIIPGLGGTQLLPRSISIGFAKEMLFRGSHINAEQAREIGLVNYVFSSNQLLQETYTIAKEIAANAPLSLKMLKKAVNNGIQTDLHTGLAFELQAYYKCADSDDRHEGIKAFNEKRSPEWKGY